MNTLDDEIERFHREHGRAPKFGEIRDYPGMNGIAVSIPVPQDPQDMTNGDIVDELVSIQEHGGVNGERYSELVDELAERSHE